MNRKKQQEEADVDSRENGRLTEVSSCDDNELPEITPSPLENLKPPRKSKIPRMAKPRRELPPEKTPDISLEIVQRENPSAT